VSLSIGGAAMVLLLHATGAIEVARAGGAEDCPDREALTELIGGVLNAPARPAANGGPEDVRAAVEFSRGAAGYQAIVRFAGAKEGQRTLTDTGASCVALGRAAAITIALVLDATAEPAAAAPRPDPAPVVAVVAPPPSEPPETRTSGVLSILGGPAVGIVGAPSVMAGAALGVGVSRRLRVEIAGQYVAPRETAFDAGTVEVGLLAARLSACATLNDPEGRWPVGICARGAGGRLRGSGSGFPAENAARDLAFWALGGGLQVQHAVATRLRLGAEATVLVPLRTYTFSVGNRGVAYESSAAAAMLQLGVGFQIW
jgi:hypothetical protein